MTQSSEKKLIDFLRNDSNKDLSDEDIIELIVNTAKARANVVMADMTLKISQTSEAYEILDEALLVYAGYLSLLAPRWPMGEQDDALALLIMDPSSVLK